MTSRSPHNQPSSRARRDLHISSGSSVASVSSAYSVTSSFRHHQNAPWSPPTPSTPKPMLAVDSTHTPKTRGSVGIMIVGLGGANGTTLLAGILANRLNSQWRGPQGQPMQPNYYGCITQLKQKGKFGGVGFKDKIQGLADASMAAVGGWDIRPTKVGDALLAHQILDYDLVRQLKEEMNKVKIFRGVYDPRFIGPSQHSTATHVLSNDEASNDSEALKCLRADIRYFKWRNGVVGHTTVIWSASVEPNCDLLENIHSARDLLEAIETHEERRGGPLPPSLLYATAALLEGCSFVNGGSQNTLSCPGLADLARQQVGVYCLGTDFKAGQTKFKTAAVEYLRTMGLAPRVIASSNHLGNNDMKNLDTAKAASSAKLRVKQDIFAPWEEDIDHKVSIMFTPEINDDKRDFVEYTSHAFLGQTHTMVTYTRASDSVLCVPLMIDAAVWCDFFAGRSWPYEKVAKALAYLFKVPEGVAKGVDPGFFRQMHELELQSMAAHEAKTSKSKDATVKKRVRIRPEEKTTEWAIPHDARIICAGLACVDMQLNHATGGDGGEHIETFAGEKSIGGGSVSMACKTLARLCHGPPLDDEYMQVTPPVVHSVIPLCKIGNDDTGNKLLSLLKNCGGCRNVDTTYTKIARQKDPSARTALAVLPIYQDGRRGCFFDAASNSTFSARELVQMIGSLSSGSTGPMLDYSQMTNDEIDDYRERLEVLTPDYGAFLFGYPHLLPQIQGEALAQVLLEARSIMIDGGIIALDLNGVPEGTFPIREGSIRSLSDLRNDAVIGMALEHVDILHLNEDELCLLTGCEVVGTAESELEDEYAIAMAVNLFLNAGVGVVAVTRGSKGSFVSCNNEERFRRTPMLPNSWVDCTARGSALQLPPGTIINSNGAGDSYTSGLLVASMLRHTGMTVPIRNEDGRDEEISPKSQIPPLKGKLASGKKRMTPYTLYMRENYVTLKQQCNDDKKAIFTKCHEMWENEADEVKSMYERKALEENEADAENEISNRVIDDMEALDSTQQLTSPSHDIEENPRNLYMTNRSLNLESAVLFASLVAAYHIDMSTRDRKHIDMLQLLERSMVFPTGLEEI
ncbi:Inositol-3-phosphate synthase [Seminavis robusta]|uniref:inositol-3-phosphate synthase n=1 Tax=Seminavis robusta TaxID=568900 RepID=A0A9N8DTB8_9STRA|nr:Inositol-3-phosphate synthase [Seminavis robusta]|eukprot:Sro273_g105120.1 Inositol-3-phosphate synthase (1085) ;mRNA; f:32532-36068